MGEGGRDGREGANLAAWAGVWSAFIFRKGEQLAVGSRKLEKISAACVITTDFHSTLICLLEMIKLHFFFLADISLKARTY